MDGPSRDGSGATATPAEEDAVRRATITRDPAAGVDADLPEEDRPTAEHGPAAGRSSVAAAPSARFGRYELRRELGRGGVGVVWEAWDPKLARSVALKSLLAGAGASEAQQARFIREVRAAATLQHPHIVPVHDAGEVDGRPYLTMDLVDGRPLDLLLGADRPAPRRVVELLVPIARALHHAHERGIVHRDVKPENILVDARGHPYLTDFGLARDQADRQRLTRTDQTVGTPAFMAPEQLRGAAPDPRMDVYGLGATLYEALAGRLPFDGASFPELLRQVLHDEPAPPRSVNPRVAPDLEAIVLTCLEKDPARRYPDARALADDLARFLAGEAVHARPPSLARRLVRRAARHPAVTVGLLVATLGLTAGAAVGLWVWELGASERRRLANLEAERSRLQESRRRDELRRALQAEALLAPTLEGQLAGFDRLLSACPDAWDAYVARARLLRTRGRELRARRRDLEGARATAERAVQELDAIVPAIARPAPLLLLQAELLRADLNDHVRALGAYRALAAREDAGPLGDYARARLHVAGGDVAAATSAVEAALAARPDLAPASLLHAQLLIRAERETDALELLDAVSGGTEADEEVARLKAEALLVAGDGIGATREAIRAVELDPTDVAAHVVLGRARLAAGEPSKGLVALERARQLSRSDPAALRLIAAWFAVAGEPRQAQTVAAEAARLEAPR